MQPPIFSLCSADSTVTSIIGAAPCRLFPFGSAPQGVAYPYAVWQTIQGAPENILDGPPDMDAVTTQIDCYADTGGEAEALASAIRTVLESDAYIVGFRAWPRDPETKRYRYTLDVDWLLSR